MTRESDELAQRTETGAEQPARRYGPNRMKRFPSFAALAIACALSSCDADLPQPPNLQPVLQAYENPTAVVGAEIMSAVADEIAEAAEAIENSQIFEEILNVIAEVQEELDKVAAKTCNDGANQGGNCSSDADCPGGACTSTGDYVLGGTCDDGSSCAADSDCPEGSCGGGVVVPSPTGAIGVDYICPGFDERQFEPDYQDEPDPANGTIKLTMTLDSNGIGRVVWGTAENCLYLVPGEGELFEASYDGGIAIDLGESLPPGQDITELLVTFVMDGDIGFDGDNYRINQSFRARLADVSGLAILVDLADPALSETFTYFFDEISQGINDATGTYGCSLEESRCFDESGTLFSW